jgi:hypothetical protein
VSEQDELERRLDHMFALARPRPGFEQELWQRIERSRPWYRRLGGLLKPAAVLAPALAVIVLGGGFLYFLAGRGHPGGAPGGTTTTSQAPYRGSAAAAAPAFGKLPAPTTTSPAAGIRPGDQAEKASALPATAMVYRFQIPANGPYVMFDPYAGEPFTGDPTTAALAYLARHGLSPHYPYATVVEAAGVRLVRQFPTDVGQARLVSSEGRPEGILVSIDGTVITGARGFKDLPVESSLYPLRRAAAGAAAELVYVTVLAGDYGFFEPALLTVSADGSRHLQSAIDPAWLLP